MKRIAIVAVAVAVFAWSTRARAGGYEFPDNGTEALGRGAAFTAKADDGTALEYNVAGLARQRGTRLLFDSNLVFHTYEFTRAGTYPDSAADQPTYGGQPFPTVHDSGGVFYVPFIALSTDFEKLDRWTFAFGLFGPSAVGNRTYGVTVPSPSGSGDMWPAPQRYDIVKANLLIAYPTLAAAFRATHWLDIGVALHLVYANFDLANVANVYLGCKSLEATACDSVTSIKTTGFTATAALGLMFHPLRVLDIGVNVRGPINVDSTGTVSATAPPSLPLDIPPDSVTFHAHLPWVVRVGLRYIFRAPDDFERADLEVDGTYEAWSQAEGNGDKIEIPNLGAFRNINPTITHHYQDTASVRVGAAYNVRLPKGVLTFRLGGFFDSAATKAKDTRLDFTTQARFAGTGGIGFTLRGFSLNVAYAFLYMFDRTVSDGDIHAVNGINGSTSTGSGDTPVVNNGHYHAQTQILSLGLTIAWEELLGKKRVVRWQ